MSYPITAFVRFQATSSPPADGPDLGLISFSSISGDAANQILWRTSEWRFSLSGFWKARPWITEGTTFTSFGSTTLAGRFPATTTPPDTDFYNEALLAFRLNEPWPNHLPFSMYMDCSTILGNSGLMRGIHPDYEEEYIGTASIGSLGAVPQQIGSGPNITEDYSSGIRYLMAQLRVTGSVTLFPSNPYSGNPSETHSFESSLYKEQTFEVGIFGVGGLIFPIYSEFSPDDLSVNLTAETTKTLSYGGAWNNDGTHT